jgi:hypothetical protein
VFDGGVVDNFGDKLSFTDTGTTEKTNFAAF